MSLDMRSYRKPLAIEWEHPPLGSVELAKRRTADMITHYGTNIRALSIETLCASCYLQGAADMLSVLDKPKVEPLDYAI